MDELVGRQIEDRYRIDDFIAAGGMGAVYRGTQLSVDRSVAIKVIKDGASDEHVAVQRFFREAQSISQLQHPNIVSLVDFGTEDDLVYLVMEFVDGFSLASALEGQHSNPAFVVEALRQIASALAEAHDRGLVHRDVKPDNLLVVRLASGHLQLKVVDFGIARMSRFETLSDSGTVIGTPYYMSPEQAQDDDIDGRADLFSLGVIAYQMITGELPWDAPEPLQVMLKICRNPLPPIRERLAEPQVWPEELLRIVERLVEKAPTARIQDAATLMERLEAIQRDHQLETPRLRPDQTLRELAGPVGATAQTAPAVAIQSALLPVVTEPSDDDISDEMARRVRLVGVVAVVGALVLITLASLTPKTDQVNQIPRAPEPREFATSVSAENPRATDLAPAPTAKDAIIAVPDPPTEDTPPTDDADPPPVELKSERTKVVVQTPKSETRKQAGTNGLEEKLDWVRTRPRGE